MTKHAVFTGLEKYGFIYSILVKSFQILIDQQRNVTDFGKRCIDDRKWVWAIFEEKLSLIMAVALSALVKTG